MPSMPAKTIPHHFILDYLPDEITLKPMFGMHAIYYQGRVIFLLRQRDKNPESNGIWVATYPLHHESLRAQFPALCSIPGYSDGKRESEWQFLPAGSDDFEAQAINLSQLVSKGDPRIGRVPKSKKK